MQILALHIPIVGFDVILGTAAIAADRQRAWVVVSVVAAVFNPLLNLALIPITESALGNTAIGAAITTVLTEIILMVGAIVLRPKGVLDGATVRVLLRIVLASLVMVPVAFVLNSASLLVVVGTSRPRTSGRPCS